MKENSYYYVSYYRNKMLIKEYIQTGEAYPGKFCTSNVQTEEILTVFYEPFTKKLKRVLCSEELWEPGRYEEFKELTPEEYKKCIKAVKNEVEIRNFTLYAQKYPGRIFRNPPKKQ